VTVQKTNNMKKNSAFKLRSGNKPSIAQLSGVSPVKLSEFQKANQKRRAQNKAKLKAKRAEAKASGKPKEPSRLQKSISNVFSSIDKGLQTFLNNPRSTAAGGEKDTYMPPKRGIASGGSSSDGGGGFTPQVRKDNWGTYRTVEGGGYEYKEHKNTSGTFTKAKSKKGIAAIDKLFKNK